MILSDSAAGTSASALAVPAASRQACARWMEPLIQPVGSCPQNCKQCQVASMSPNSHARSWNIPGLDPRAFCVLDPITICLPREPRHRRHDDGEKQASLSSYAAPLTHPLAVSCLPSQLCFVSTRAAPVLARELSLLPSQPCHLSAFFLLSLVTC